MSLAPRSSSSWRSGRPSGMERRLLSQALGRVRVRGHPFFDGVAPRVVEEPVPEKIGLAALDDNLIPADPRTQGHANLAGFVDGNDVPVAGQSPDPSDVRGHGNPEDERPEASGKSQFKSRPEAGIAAIGARPVRRRKREGGGGPVRVPRCWDVGRPRVRELMGGTRGRVPARASSPGSRPPRSSPPPRRSASPPSPRTSTSCATARESAASGAAVPTRWPARSPRG
jgi:hypothetical protein